MKSAQQLYEFFSTFPLHFWNYCTPIRGSYVEKSLWVRFQTTSENDGGLYYLNSLYFYSFTMHTAGKIDCQFS